MSKIQDGLSTLSKLSKGLTQIFNAQAEDKRVHNALKKMKPFELNQAIRDGVKNETGQLQKLTDDQRMIAERERLKKDVSHQPKPK